ARLRPDELTYACEGQDMVLCTYSGRRSAWQGTVLRLPKAIRLELAAEGAPGGGDAAEGGTAAHAGPPLPRRARGRPARGRRPPGRRRARRRRGHPPGEARGAARARPGDRDPRRTAAGRLRSALEAPPGAAAGAPVLAVELGLGCGLREVADLPSRHAMARRLHWGARADPETDPVALFSGDAGRALGALRARVGCAGTGGDLRVFVDGRPVDVPDLAGGEGAMRVPGLEGCFVNSSEGLAEAVAGVLATRKLEVLGGLQATPPPPEAHRGGPQKAKAPAMLPESAITKTMVQLIIEPTERIVAYRHQIEETKRLKDVTGKDEDSSCDSDSDSEHDNRGTRGRSTLKPSSRFACIYSMKRADSHNKRAQFKKHASPTRFVSPTRLVWSMKREKFSQCSSNASLIKRCSPRHIIARKTQGKHRGQAQLLQREKAEAQATRSINEMLHAQHHYAIHEQHQRDQAITMTLAPGAISNAENAAREANQHETADNSNPETTSTTIEITALARPFARVIHRGLDDVATVPTDSPGPLQLAKRAAFTSHDPDLAWTPCVFYDMAYPNFEHGSLAASCAPTVAAASHLREPAEARNIFNDKINKRKTTMASLYDEDLHIIGIQEAKACSVLYGIGSGCDPDSKGDHYPVRPGLAFEITSSTSMGVPKLDEHKLADDACRKKTSDKLQAHATAPSAAATLTDHLDRAKHYYDTIVQFLNLTRPMFRTWVREDRDAFLEKTADEMSAAIDNHSPGQEAPHAKRLLAFRGRKPNNPPTPSIRSTADGKPPTTKTSIANDALAYNGKVEMSKTTDADVVANDYNDRASTTRPAPKIQNIMPRHQLASQLSAAKRGRRGGPNRVTNDMSRADPDGVARLPRPILVKTQVESAEPIAAKGGYSTHFYKGRGAMEQQKSYRGVFLNSAIGKMHSSFLPSRVKVLLPNLLEATQCGARPKMASDFITHTSLAVITDCQRRARSGGITFLDLVEAFHSVTWEFCMEPPTAPDELDDLIEQIDIPAFLKPSLIDRLKQPAYNNQRIDDQHLCRITADHHTSNWMTAKSARHYQQPRTSTRPGVPYSDVAYNTHFAIMLRAIDHAASDADEGDQPSGGRDIPAGQTPLFSATPHEGGALRNVSFVDDLAIYNSADSASDLLHVTRLSATRLHAAACQDGLKPHPDKTTAILMHYGSGAKKERQKIAREKVTHTELENTPIKVQLVTQQKALGTIISAGGVMRDHIATKYMGPCRVAASMPNTTAPDKHFINSEAIAKTGIPGQLDSDFINWARQKPKLFTDAVKAATKSYLHYARRQAQLARFHRAIRMPTATSSTVETENPDHDSKTQYACYICGRAAAN
ncbi:unnamed protein product, partial [Prorocentrum cordatum]